MRKTVERNEVLARSVFQRSLAKAREARDAFLANPHPGTYERWKDRILAALVQRRKLAAIRRENEAETKTLRGAALSSYNRKTEAFHEGHATAYESWRTNYFKESGFK